MFELDLKSRKSISLQIIDRIKELIVSGVICEGSKIPSVREMAAELTVNPNTVQKAYRVLEQQGYIYTSPGRGTFVSDRKDTAASPAEIAEAEKYLKESINNLNKKLNFIWTYTCFLHQFSFYGFKGLLSILHAANSHL